jgi:hypothetical protein
MGPYVPRLGNDHEEHKKFLRSSADPDEHMRPFFFSSVLSFLRFGFDLQSSSSPFLSSVLQSSRPRSISLVPWPGCAQPAPVAPHRAPQPRPSHASGAPPDPVPTVHKHLGLTHPCCGLGAPASPAPTAARVPQPRPPCSHQPCCGRAPPHPPCCGRARPSARAPRPKFLVFFIFSLGY